MKTDILINLFLWYKFICNIFINYICMSSRIIFLYYIFFIIKLFLFTKKTLICIWYFIYDSFIFLYNLFSMNYIIKTFLLFYVNITTSNWLFKYHNINRRYSFYTKTILIFKIKKNKIYDKEFNTLAVNWFIMQNNISRCQKNSG